MTPKLLILAVTEETRDFTQEELKESHYYSYEITGDSITIEFWLLDSSDIYQELLKIKRLRRCFINYFDRHGYYNLISWNEENCIDGTKKIKLSFIPETEELRKLVFNRINEIKSKITEWKITTNDNDLIILEGKYFKWFLNSSYPETNDLHLKGELKLSVDTYEEIREEFKLLDDIRDYQIAFNLSASDLVDLLFS